MEKMKRNSKADLGGFNSDKEWVEYIDKWYWLIIGILLEGAILMIKRVNEIWLVDSGAVGCYIVDILQLDGFEYGTAMKVVPLMELI